MGGGANERRQRMDEFRDVFCLQQLAAEYEQDLQLLLAKTRLVSFIARLLRKSSSDDAGCQEGEERKPVLGVGDGEGAQRRQKIEVIASGGGYRDDNRVPEAEARGDKQDKQQ